MDFKFNQTVKDTRDGKVYKVVEQKPCGNVVCADKRPDITITTRIKKEYLELVQS